MQILGPEPGKEEQHVPMWMNKDQQQISTAANPAHFEDKSRATVRGSAGVCVSRKRIEKRLY